MIQEFFFESRGIYYRMNVADPKKQTIVFVHGLSGSSSAWIPYERALADTFNIISLDLRGHGKSVKPVNYEDYAISKFADDFTALVTYLSLEKFVLVGHSLGVFVVLAFLEKHKEKVSALVLLSPNFSGSNMRSSKILIPFLRTSVWLIKKIPFSGGTAGHIDYRRFPNTGDWNILRMLADIRNTSVHGYLYGAEHAYSFDGEHILKKISMPSLIIHGRKDTVFPLKYGIAMAGKIPGSKMVIFPDADHILALNKVPEVADAIKDFVLK